MSVLSAPYFHDVVAPDLARTEYGSVEVQIHSITRWNEKPALSATDRLSGEKVTCVLTPGLAERLGSHSWGEAWEGRRLLVSGALHFSRDGTLKRVSADEAEDMPWTNVDLHDLRDIDIVGELSVSQHVNMVREENLGTDAQAARFAEAARAIGADEDEAAFRAKLATIAQQRPEPETPKPTPKRAPKKMA